MNRLTLVPAMTALALATAGTAPSSASHDQDFGFTCGMTYRSQDGREYSGEIAGGPWYHYATQPGERFALRCTIQAWNGDRWDVLTFADSGEPTSSPVASVPPRPVRFLLPPNTFSLSWELCTEVIVYRDPNTPPEVRRVDADNQPGNGAQCSQQESDASTQYAYVGWLPPSFHGGRRCVYVEVPPVPRENCFPSPV